MSSIVHHRVRVDGADVRARGTGQFGEVDAGLVDTTVFNARRHFGVGGHKVMMPDGRAIVLRLATKLPAGHRQGFTPPGQRPVLLVAAKANVRLAFESRWAHTFFNKIKTHMPT